MKDEYNILCSKIRNVNKGNFEQVALEVFNFQAQHNPLYQQFIKLLGILPHHITKLAQIPFLPISFFKFHTIKTQKWEEVMTFQSSGTTLQQPAKHYIRNLEWYNHFAVQTFEQQYGDLSDFVILGLLPSYLERGGSSLVYMVEQFVKKSKHQASGFFLHDFANLKTILEQCQKSNKKVLLIGVTYALLDFAEKYAMPLDNVILMETGGMKGRREEWTKQQVHEVLQTAFSLPTIHSEYGMTELLSQAYSKGQGLFESSETMRVLTREITDPFRMMPAHKSGGINIIDLVNIDTCSFIATDDLGRMKNEMEFEILGRLSASDLRGCNLLVGE